jgi:SAM-dependent methyltransferase
MLEKYREKWREVPGGDDAAPRRFTTDLVNLRDPELLAFWDDMAARRDASALAFLQPLYRDFFRDRHIVDVGSGLGLDGMRFAVAGARWTFADIAPSNLALLERVAKLKGLGDRVSFHLIKDDLSFDAVQPADAVIAIGSLHHVPFDVARRECAAILGRLKRPARWLELVYPRTRWEKEGRPAFERWGAMTDGERTPWSEWYDADKLRQRLAPQSLRTVLDFDFQGTDFHWFDFELA